MTHELHEAECFMLSLKIMCNIILLMYWCNFFSQYKNTTTNTMSVHNKPVEVPINFYENQASTEGLVPIDAKVGGCSCGGTRFVPVDVKNAYPSAGQEEIRTVTNAEQAPTVDEKETVEPQEKSTVVGEPVSETTA